MSSASSSASSVSASSVSASSASSVSASSVSASSVSASSSSTAQKSMQIPKKMIATYSKSEVGPNWAKLSNEAKKYLDKGNVQYEGVLEFSDAGEYTDFVIGWLIFGLTDQQDMKCLLPANIQYLSHSIGKDPPVHGHCLSIRDGIITFPINQKLEMGTKFRLSIQNSEPIKLESGNIPPMRAMRILSNQLKPVSPLPKGLKPFSNRTYLLHVLPGETLEATYVVGTTNQFSLREMTYFERPARNVLIFGTMLGRDPADLLRTVASQLEKRMKENINNIYLKRLLESGYKDGADQAHIGALLDRLFDEIRNL
jgi:hypothetical protein